MLFTYRRTVHFADTDAAGVVFFANTLAICHEAYEEALGAAGIELRTFFSDTGVVVPIAKSEASYLRPLRPGDLVRVTGAPAPLSADSYEIRFRDHAAGLPRQDCRTRPDRARVHRFPHAGEAGTAARPGRLGKGRLASGQGEAARRASSIRLSFPWAFRGQASIAR